MGVVLDILGIVVGAAGVIMGVIAYRRVRGLSSRSWKDIVKEVDKLHNHLALNDVKFDYIVSFAGGGLIVADLLHIRHYPRTPVLSLHVQRTKRLVSGAIKISVLDNLINTRELKGKAVLVVDDVVESGRSLDKVVEFLEEEADILGEQVYAVVIGKLRSTNGFKVRYYGFEYWGKLSLPWAVVPRELPFIIEEEGT